MSEERKQYVRIALGYNCLMLAAGLAAFAVSIWLLISGRLFQEGVDATFLFAAGIVLGTSFLMVPALSIRDGLLRDLRKVNREVSERYEEAKSYSISRTRPQRAWQQSHAH